jgi:hypothetical protein
MNFRYAAASAAQLVALACSAVLLAQPASAGEPRAVIELFTSQGCSSCPPADMVLGELAKDPTLVTMSLPVDYWDYLGWKDTLALHGHSNRERAYATARGDREVYTPQVVVNGAVPVLGSDKAAIEQAIAQTRSAATAMNVPMTLTVVDGKVTATLAAAKDGAKDRSGEVWLCPITSKVPVQIERGENRGHTLTYYNVVRRWVKLGDWDGQARSFSIPLADVAAKDIDTLAVVMQGGSTAKPGPMLGAAIASLH